MLFMNVDCKTLVPLIKLLKFGIIPIIQAAIIVVLIVLLIIDLGKAVMAGKEDEIKTAQKLAIKRVVYALVVFLVPWIVNVAVGLLANASGNKETELGYTNADTAWGCWANTTKNGYKCVAKPAIVERCTNIGGTYDYENCTCLGNGIQ